MAIIEIKLNISNPQEIITKEKGRFSGMLAGFFLDEPAIKAKVEEKVGAEIVKKLKETITPALLEQGIKAEVTISLITRQEVKVM